MRVLIALRLKAIRPERLIEVGAAVQAGAYRERNPEGKVPAVSVDGGPLLAQSAAILEHLEDLEVRLRGCGAAGLRGWLWGCGA